MKSPDKTVRLLAAAITAFLLAACSTTSRLPEGEILYTGVKKTVITPPEGEKVASGVASQIKGAVNVKPNNCLISPSLRYPFPIGLWVWNHWNEPKKGIGKWIYSKLVEQPVLISDVRPDVRVAMIDRMLDNNGYFQGHASYSLVQGKNPRKASIRYEISTGSAYNLDSIIMLADTTALNRLINESARRSAYLRPGSRYSVDSLKQVRIDIANRLRNKGYYFFSPEYIEYLADSTITKGAIALKLDLAANIPSWAMKSYKVGRITTVINRNSGTGTPDTFQTDRGTVIQMQPSHLRRKLIPECIAFRTGKTFSVRDMNRTQTYLSRLGIFSEIDISAIPDTLAPEPTLDIDINCRFDKPLEATVEVNASSKSNSYIGPGVVLGLTNKNLFGGGEQFSVKLNGSYEWQTGSHRGKSSVFNSYEVGLTTSLAFPRLLGLNWVTRRRRVLNWTRITLNADLLNRPHYFKMAQFNASYSYDWQHSRYVNNSLTLVKLTYTKLIHTTHDFDSIMNANEAIAQSFKDQYIPQMAYTWTYDRNYHSRRTLNVQLSVQEAGNIFWGIYRAFGHKGEKELFGTPFSQFVKGQAQVVYGQRLSRHNIWLVSRVLVGAAHAYGNSSEVPYSEQFYIGGANSIRAFTVRSLGPGSYHAPDDQTNGYFDQTGTFKFELNTELRFPIYGPLHGAVFLDAGNIWLLKNDPARPGGTLRAKTFWKDIALGTGVGLRFDISMFVVRADLGIGIHAPYDTGRSGYYNMTSFGKSLAFHLAIGYPF